MTDEELAGWREYTEVGYADAIGPARGLTPEQALKQSRKEIGELLAERETASEHLIWSACSPDGTVVGNLWIRARKPVPFVFNIEVNEDQRGHGYGRAIMLAGQEECRRLGFDRLDLNVFYNNQTAVNLYTSLGYVVISQQMRKEL
ncbi:GNAT family N-acetyltransferase [Kribbella qitaiheensis]|uniref:GNAT family N-acetyltransferase n=2 Tax=Kribbella qitaiheensis TaxID=1544730 RepID=A0A7G6X9V1_9ACTN|nr:GNAT family N-acetyltransferase [Kribbella qitaiheensis]